MQRASASAAVLDKPDGVADRGMVRNGQQPVDVAG